MASMVPSNRMLAEVVKKGILTGASHTCAPDTRPVHLAPVLLWRLEARLLTRRAVAHSRGGGLQRAYGRRVSRVRYQLVTVALGPAIEQE